jgi:hypothetical protein
MIEVPGAAIRSFRTMHAATSVQMRLPHAPVLVCSFFPKWLEQSTLEKLDELENRIKEMARGN